MCNVHSGEIEAHFNCLACNYLPFFPTVRRHLSNCFENEKENMLSKSFSYVCLLNRDGASEKKSYYFTIINIYIKPLSKIN